MKNAGTNSKYLLTCAALTLASLATGIASAPLQNTNNQSKMFTKRHLSSVICEQIKVANSSYEGHQDDIKEAYPLGCLNIQTNKSSDKLFQKKCSLQCVRKEEMKYHKFYRSLHSFANTFALLNNGTNPMSTHLGNAKQTIKRKEVLDAFIKSVLSLQTELNESWNKDKEPMKVPPCYELKYPSPLQANTVSEVCFAEIELFRAYGHFLDNSHKAFCQTRKKKICDNTRKGKGNKVLRNKSKIKEEKRRGQTSAGRNIHQKNVSEKRGKDEHRRRGLLNRGPMRGNKLPGHKKNKIKDKQKKQNNISQ